MSDVPEPVDAQMKPHLLGAAFQHASRATLRERVLQTYSSLVAPRHRWKNRHFVSVAND